MEIIKESQKEALKEFFQKRSPAEKKAFILVIIGIFVALDIYFWAWPAAKQFLAKRKDLESIKVQLQEREREIAAKDKVSQEWKDVIGKVEEKKASFFYDGELSALTGTIFKQASEVGLKIVNLTPNENKPKAIKNIFYQEVSFKIDAIATLHQLGRFVERIENGPFFFKIKNLSIASDPAENKRNVIQMDLEVLRKKEGAS